MEQTAKWIRNFGKRIGSESWARGSQFRTRRLLADCSSCLCGENGPSHCSECQSEEIQPSADELNENRNLVWNKRVKARLILIFSTNTNRESVAYRSFRPSEFEARGVRKVTTGITGLWQPSVHSDVAF
ncbi:hypothetical protein N665_0791s0001 [Sinapis alba]|nr:hypothetical protein N665_0791s0001 [Sinapis alba]